jgi:c-di-GMP-binding flagellar brake protein YcgR
MATFDNRKYSRFGSFLLTSYDCLNDNDEPFHHGMGRALNVSEGGICLETHTPIDAHDRLSITMMIEDEYVEVSGRVAYCDESKDEKYYRYGVEFLQIEDSAMQVLENYIGIRI